MMAAVAAPPAVAGATTTVTVSGTVPGNNLAIVFPASDPFVVSNPSMPFNFSAVAPGGAPPTASVEMGLAIRVWMGRSTIDLPATRIHANNTSSLTVAFTGAAFSRILSELAASGLLAAGPFTHQRDADAALSALVITNHALLELQPADFFPVDPFDTPAVAAVAAAPVGRGRGRGRGRGPAAVAVPGQAAIAAVPGPPNLAFLDICSMLAFADAHGGPHPLMTFCLLVGALGPLASHASRLNPRSSVHALAHALRSSSALSAGVDAATAAPPAGDTIIFSSVPQTIESAYGALTGALALDKITALGLSSELRDALVFARGDQAQCDAILTRRLIFLKDWCGPPRTRPPPFDLALAALRPHVHRARAHRGAPCSRQQRTSES